MGNLWFWAAFAAGLIALRNGRAVKKAADLQRRLGEANEDLANMRSQRSYDTARQIVVGRQKPSGVRYCERN